MLSNVYHVLPRRRSGTWEVMRVGRSRAVMLSLTQDEAVDRISTRLSRTNATLVIHNRQGTVEAVRSFHARAGGEHTGAAIGWPDGARAMTA